MTALNSATFSEFFTELYGYGPFPWQRRLAERVAGGDWPGGITLPTASGKTACIDIAVFALACQSGLWAHDKPTSPRRIFFVVDRRLIVDEAYDRAQHLARKLRDARSGIVHQVASALRELAGGDEPLACFQLRGGIYRDDAWARTPIQPTVIASTVDQIGSRLLQRGYGVSPYGRSIHAGLVANDCLIILDEAHCARPFMQTLKAVHHYRGWGDAASISPFQVVVMSATPPPEVTDTLSLSTEDQSHAVLGPRLKATKPILLYEARKARGSKVMDLLADELCDKAEGLAGDGPKAVAVIVNRVATAKAVYRLLLERRGDDSDVVLLTGRMRPIDRDATVHAWLDKLNASGSSHRQLTRSVFVVATQCLEVGANLDFDAMVSECAGLDALRQRFGRLNRMGRDIQAQGVIVIRGDQVSPKEEDPIYGPALPKTWEWLGRHAVKGTIDFGIQSLDSLTKKISTEDLAEMLAPTSDAPVMLPSHVDCWSQTSPEPSPSPDVSLFLHGPQRNAPEVQVCWRADLDPGQADEVLWTDIVALCPTSSIECMPVPLHVLRRWWSEPATPSDDLADMEGGQLPQAQDSPDVEPTTDRVALCWRGPEESRLVRDANDIRPGDTVVLPASLGGWETFGHIPDVDPGDPAVDVGDRAHLQSRRKAVLRIHPQTVQSWPGCPAKTALLALATVAEPPEDVRLLRDLLGQLAREVSDPPWLHNAALALAKDRRLQVLKYLPDGLALCGSQRLSPNAQGDDTYTSEDDSASATVPVSLDRHLAGMARTTTVFAQKCRLSKELVEDMALVASLHDLGKADPRFQMLLYGGDLRAARMGETLAKSGKMRPPTKKQQLDIDRLGPPRGWRHELFSLQLAEAQPDLLAEAHDRDLVLHLIASHHGRCRPFAPVVFDELPPTLSITLTSTPITLTQEQRRAWVPPYRLDSGIAERFWSLTRRYGWWGLAYMEAILRLADHRTSESEQTEYQSRHLDSEVTP